MNRRRDARLVAIDPGDAHVGVAEFANTEGGPTDWSCVWVKEMYPAEFVDWFEKARSRYDEVIYEVFRLYPDKAMAQTGSEMLTAQLIGVIKYLARDAVGQPASWQQTALGVLRADGVQSRAKLERAGDHCLSAELHGWAYLIQNNLYPGKKEK